MGTSSIYEMFERELKDFIELDRKSSTVVSFVENHTRLKYGKVFQRTNQPLAGRNFNFSDEDTEEELFMV